MGERTRPGDMVVETPPDHAEKEESSLNGEGLGGIKGRINGLC